MNKTLVKIENIKEFMEYLEHKEKQTIIPKIESILKKWNDVIAGLDKRLNEFI